MQDNILPLIGRTVPLFTEDVSAREAELSSIVSSSRFLVIGRAGSIGSAVAREISARSPRLLHVVGIRSSMGCCDGEFATFAIDCGSDIMHEKHLRAAAGSGIIHHAAAGTFRALPRLLTRLLLPGLSCRYRRKNAGRFLWTAFLIWKKNVPA